MKSQKVKNKVLEKYINNVPIRRIAKEEGVAHKTIIEWKNNYGWEKLKQEYITKSYQNVTNQLINLQTELGLKATQQLMYLLNNGKLKSSDLVNIAKHGLDVVRPKQVTNNLNISKTDNQIQIIMPKEVEELLNGEISSNKETRLRLLEAT